MAASVLWRGLFLCAAPLVAASAFEPPGPHHEPRADIYHEPQPNVRDPGTIGYDDVLRWLEQDLGARPRLHLPVDPPSGIKRLDGHLDIEIELSPAEIEPAPDGLPTAPDGPRAAPPGRP